MADLNARVQEIWGVLHKIPEVGFEEQKTSAYLAGELKKAGYATTTQIGGTGVLGVLDSGKPGPTLMLRADMDALGHEINGELCAIHSCGHDSHCAMVLTVAEEVMRRGIQRGKLKILFQPAEEKLFGALRTIEAGVIDDVDIILGIHLRPGQEAKTGQAVPALHHASSYIVEATIEGLSAHGARPHLGINAIEAAVSAIQAVSWIHMDPNVPGSAKVTKLSAGGAALNAIPDKAEMAFDLRSQRNELMEELVPKVLRAIELGANAAGAKAKVTVKGGVPAAQYDAEITALAQKAITAVLGPAGLLGELSTPGGEDFHFFVKHKPSLKAGYIGLGCNLTPGLHHPAMQFDTGALVGGVEILLYMANDVIGLGG